MRTLIASGTCSRCRRSRPVWRSAYSPPLETLVELIECDMSAPDRCDACELLARLADPAYRDLCWPAADRMEADALAAGGLRPPAEREKAP